MKLRAHGKVFLAGEYAVLEGRRALVLGVDRFLNASVEPAERLSVKHAPSGLVWGGGPPPPELRFAVRALLLARPAQPVRLVFLDDFALPPPQRGLSPAEAFGDAPWMERRESRQYLKPGLGGSAAASVIAVRAAQPAWTEAQVLAVAAAAHWIEQGGSGSGGDVAASALGGLLAVESRVPWRSVEEALALPLEALLACEPVVARPIVRPARLRLLLAFTGASADTRKLTRAVRGFPGRGPFIARIGTACEALIAALAVDVSREMQGAEEAALQAVRDGAAAMAALGEAAGAPIVTPELARIAALAASAGAAAKPSGAGGGDCAVVFAFGDEPLVRAEALLAPHFQTMRLA